MSDSASRPPACRVAECAAPAAVRGMCKRDYSRWYKQQAAEAAQRGPWCGQCESYTDHETNRCPVGRNVRCLTHERWMVRGAADCTDERYGTPPPNSRPCEAAS